MILNIVTRFYFVWQVALLHTLFIVESLKEYLSFIILHHFNIFSPYSSFKKMK